MTRNVFGGIMGFTLIPEENWVGGLRVLEF
jgi:hypothetical protein